jgi:rod shape-determining protein MreC
LAKIGASQSEIRYISAIGIALVCIAFAIVLLFILPRSDPRVAQLRQFSYDLVSPVIQFVSLPFQAARRSTTEVGNILDLRAENARLVDENDALRRRVNELAQARVLMEQYRNLLNLPEEPGLTFLNARIVADLSSPFARTVIANIGKDAGVAQGDPVMGRNGLVGRVISAGDSSSRILLLTDFNSHIPVVALSSDAQAILSGRNEDETQLEFLSRQAKLKNGDLLVTSGSGGQMPIGLPVGSIVVSEEGESGVELLDAPTGLTYVRIVKSVMISPPDTEVVLERPAP